MNEQTRMKFLAELQMIVNEMRKHETPESLKNPAGEYLKAYAKRKELFKRYGVKQVHPTKGIVMCTK